MRHPIVLVPVLMVFSFYASAVKPETFFELNANVGKRDLLVFRKQAENLPEESTSIGAGIGFYRAVSSNASWGGVIELADPRDYELTEGSGKILGFRPVNYRRQWLQRFATEVYFGIAQYQWIKRASGYYAGANFRFAVDPRAKWSLGYDYRRYQDLAHDEGPGGDQIVYGFTHSLALFYRF